MPTPLRVPRASACAPVMACLATSTAVSKPKVLSTHGTSLSTVLGTPTTLMGRPRLLALQGDGVGAAEGAVAADAEEDVEAVALERVDHHADVLMAAGESEHRAAVAMHVGDRRRVEVDGRRAEGGVEPLEAVAEPEDVAHPVLVVELEHHRAEHVVEPGAEPAAGHDADAGAHRVEEDVLPGPGALEARRGGRLAVGDLHVDEHAPVVLGVVGQEIPGDDGEVERRRDAALAEPTHRVLIANRLGFLVGHGSGHDRGRSPAAQPGDRPHQLRGSDSSGWEKAPMASSTPMASSPTAVCEIHPTHHAAITSTRPTIRARP